jgi:hypothetical protein
MCNAIVVESCYQNECMVANAGVLGGVKIDYLLAICQVHIGNWYIDSIDNFINLVALRSTEIASRAVSILISVLQTDRVFKQLECLSFNRCILNRRQRHNCLWTDYSTGTWVNEQNLNWARNSPSCLVVSLNCLYLYRVQLACIIVW